MPRVGALPAAVALIALVVSGCGSGDAEPPRSTSSDTTSPSESATPVGSLARCVQSVTEDVPASPVEIEAADGSTLSAARFGTGRTVLVLLHQIDGDGLCGWIPFAGLAAQRGFTALAIDMCGWGESQCSDAFDFDATAQVSAAVDWARRDNPRRRVVLVGASMGGSRAVLAAGDRLPIDAYVDVSGPANWDTKDLVDVADQIRAPGLLVYAREDDPAAFTAARTVAQRSGGTFQQVPRGHGYEILLDESGQNLSRFGREVLRFAARHGG
jgi:pimeloyl-ACP methyl ester carboxylesterase